MATAAKTTTTLDVRCPKCMNPDETVRLNLNDLPECECSGCGETFTPAEDVETFTALTERWRAAAAWIDAAPAA
jgi:hypothetical protein